MTFHVYLTPTTLAAILLTCSLGSAQQLAQWQPQPSDWKGAVVEEDQATLQSSGWAYLMAPGEFSHVEVSATFTIEAPATQFRFFGQSWSVWPDPDHHSIFADEWPKLTFSQFVPLSKTWIYGRTPFMTGHNQRPTYELEKNCGAGSGFAMKLGPASFGKANLPVGPSLAKGRWAITALVKSTNAHGPGG